MFVTILPFLLSSASANAYDISHLHNKYPFPDSTLSFNVTYSKYLHTPYSYFTFIEHPATAEVHTILYHSVPKHNTSDHSGLLVTGKCVIFNLRPWSTAVVLLTFLQNNQKTQIDVTTSSSTVLPMETSGNLWLRRQVIACVYVYIYYRYW